MSGRGQSVHRYRQGVGSPDSVLWNGRRDFSELHIKPDDNQAVTDRAKGTGDRSSARQMVHLARPSTNPSKEITMGIHRGRKASAKRKHEAGGANPTSRVARSCRTSRPRNPAPHGIKLRPIVPTGKALAQVEAAYSARSPAEKWRLAQAQTLIDMFVAPTTGLKGKRARLKTGGRKRHLELTVRLSKKQRAKSNQSHVAQGG